ncbi:MAG: TetR/AcrR family transcriptional regulator [Phototrophicaceae bacterium]
MVDDPLLLPHSDCSSRADARRNRELLIQVAGALFHERGADAVSMSEIAETAQVGKGTLYRHFKNKGEVCDALLDHDMRQLQMRVLTHLQQEPQPRLALYWFVEQVLDFVLRNTSLLHVQIVEGSMTMLNHSAHLWWRQTILGLMGRLGTHAQSSYFADAVYILLDVRTLQFQMSVLGYSRQQILEGLIATVDRLVD